MGQKVNPVGLRIGGLNYFHNWFASGLVDIRENA